MGMGYIKMNKRQLNERKRDAVRIFRLLRETKITIENILILFPNFNATELQQIYVGDLFNRETEKFKDVNNEYVEKLFKSNNIYPLGEVYIREIYIFSKLNYFSRSFLSNIFGISESSIKRICYGITHKEEKLEKINYNDFRISVLERKRKYTKNPNHLSELEKKKIVKQYLNKLKKGETTLIDIANMFNISVGTVESIFKDKFISKNNPNKLSEQTIKDIYKKVVLEGETIVDIAAKYNLSEKTVSNIKNEYTHKKIIAEFKAENDLF